jgi:hypothetical protein
MPKTISDFFSVPLNPVQKPREISQGLRDQLLPEKLSDIFGRVFTSIDAIKVNDTAESHLAVVISKIDNPSGLPPVGSIPWIRSQDINSAHSEQQVSNVCYVASYDRVNVFNVLPENITNKTDLDYALERDLILCYEEGIEPSFNISQGSIVKIEFIKWPTEARIIAVQEKNTPFPDNNENVQNAFANSDGETLDDKIPFSNIKPSSRTRRNICDDTDYVNKLAAEIGIQPAMLAAIRAVESSGSPKARNFLPNKFNTAIIQKYPNNYQDKLMPFTPGVKNGQTLSFSLNRQETGTAAFEKAYSIDPQLAIESAAWGAFQVVGKGVSNQILKPNGKYTPEEFINLYNSNPQQLSTDLTKAWWKNSQNAINAANDKDFHKLARIYNGPTYAREGYQNLIADAYQQAIRCKEYKK